MRALTCWVVTEGTVGMESQCIGLAEALGLDPVVKRCPARLPWRVLPPGMWPAPLEALAPGSDPLAPPWPDVLISSGRKVVAAAVAIRRASRGRTFAVHVQRPLTRLNHFDLVVVPAHDRVRGENVLVTRGALTRVTPTRLAAAAQRFAPDLAHLPRPLVAVAVGGTNRVYRFTPRLARRLGDELAALALRYRVGLAVTPSRRTGAVNEAILRERLADAPSVVWDGHGENPYFGYLALADSIVVTCDSVNMVSEACTTGKPVHVFHLEGGSAKFRRFHERFARDGLTRPFDGTLESWRYPPLDDTSWVAAEIRRRLAPRLAEAPEAAVPA